VAGEVDFAALGVDAPAGDVIAFDWRAGTATRLGADARLPMELAKEGWAYLVLAPVFAGGLAVIGDASKFVTAGDARLEVTSLDEGVRLVVKGAGETVTVTGWAATTPAATGGRLSYDEASSLWRLEVDVPSRGWATAVLNR
jgi:hypothetical protein